MGDAGQQARKVVEELRTALQATAVQSVKTTRSLAKFDEINRLPAPAVEKAAAPEKEKRTAGNAAGYGPAAPPKAVTAGTGPMAGGPCWTACAASGRISGRISAAFLRRLPQPGRPCGTPCVRQCCASGSRFGPSWKRCLPLRRRCWTQSGRGFGPGAERRALYGQPFWPGWPRAGRMWRALCRRSGPGWCSRCCCSFLLLLDTLWAAHRSRSGMS